MIRFLYPIAYAYPPILIVIPVRAVSEHSAFATPLWQLPIGAK